MSLLSGHVNGIGSGHTSLSMARGLVTERPVWVLRFSLLAISFPPLAQLSIVQLSIGKQRKNGGRGLDKRPRQKGCNVGGGTRSSFAFCCDMISIAELALI